MGCRGGKIAPLPANLPTFTADEVAKHNKSNDLWFIVDGIVYDLTDFRDEHPGGDEILLVCAW
jgi:cytochrome b involved in lipid metabolism